MRGSVVRWIVQTLRIHRKVLRVGRPVGPEKFLPPTPVTRVWGDSIGALSGGGVLVHDLRVRDCVAREIDIDVHAFPEFSSEFPSE
jgi:hypothetical protein